MGGGKQKSTTSSSSEPWSAAQPYLKDIYTQAQDLYNSGAPEFWGGTANAPLTQQMQDALGGIWNRAAAGTPGLDQAQSMVGGIAGGGAVGTNPAYDFLMGTLYGGNQNPAQGYASDMAANYQGNPAIQYLQNEASGANVGANPMLNAMFNKAAAPLTEAFNKTTLPGIGSNYALAGRYGSRALTSALGAAQQNVNDQLTNLATNLYGGAYTTDRANQLQAMQGLSQANAQDVSNRLGIGNFMSGIYDQNLQRQLYGAQTLGSLGQQDVSNMLQAAGMVPGLQQAGYGDLNQMMNVGQYLQGRSQSEQDLQRQRYDYGQNEPLNWLQQYAQLIYGNPGSSGAFGDRTQTTTQSGGSTFGNILGGVLGAGSFIAGLPSIGAGFSTLGSWFGR